MKLESEGIKAIKEIFTNGSYTNNNIKIQRVLENLRSKDDDNIESNNNNNSNNNSNISSSISSSSRNNNEMSTGLNEDEDELTDEDIDNNKKF